MALGHYHIPSDIREHIRYCGSPIPMGFGEAGQKKCVYLVDFSGKQTITKVEVPLFQRLESVRGDKQQIESRLNELKKLDETVWAEVIYEGKDLFPDFSTWVKEQAENSKIEVLKFQNRQYIDQLLSVDDYSESLDTLDEAEVFDILLEKNDFTDEAKTRLEGFISKFLMVFMKIIKRL